MGLNSRVFDLLATHCKRGDRDGRALVAGYPDMVVDEKTLAKHLDRLDDLNGDPQAEKIRKMHGFMGPVFSPHDVFHQLGYRLTIIDIHKEHGEEEIVDLDQAQICKAEFDLVLDHGTIEHCFNIGVAAVNLAASVKEGGWIVQHLPLSMFNHGFYNINPTWFWSFYEQNGFEIVHFEGWTLNGEPFEVSKHGGFQLSGAERTLCTMIARRKVMQPIKFPIQERYRTR